MVVCPLGAPEGEKSAFLMERRFFGENASKRARTHKATQARAAGGRLSPDLGGGAFWQAPPASADLEKCFFVALWPRFGGVYPFFSLLNMAWWPLFCCFLHN